MRSMSAVVLEQAFDERVAALGGGRFAEVGDVLNGGGASGEVEGGLAEEGEVVEHVRFDKSLELLVVMHDEGVDLGRGLGLVDAELVEHLVLGDLFLIHTFFFGEHKSFRPLGAGLDPAFEGVDLAAAERLAFARHDVFVIVVEGDEFDDERLGRFADDDGGSLLAALHEVFAGVHAQVPAHLFLPVAAYAGLFENGLDFPAEIRRGALGMQGREGNCGCQKGS